MVAAAENMQTFGWDLFPGNRDSVFLGSGSIAGDELDISSFVVLPGFVHYKSAETDFPKQAAQ